MQNQKIKNIVSKFLALDIGKKRTGIASTDDNKIIATALITVETSKLEEFLKQYISQNKVDKILIGYPKDMNNLYSDAVKYIDPVINRLKKVFKEIEFSLVDERFTSKMAFQTMIDSGITKSKRRDKSTVDKISATIILQSYLEQLKYNNKK